MKHLKARQVIGYVTMPRIVPRIKGLLSSGFSFVAYLMAQIYFMVRLLPRHHPYLMSENIGRFGVRHVVAEASRSLTFSWRNLDQLVIYFSILVGIVILLAQIVISVYAVVVSPAMAFSWFDTADPSIDIAYNILDRIFGVPNVFCSSITPANCTNYSGNTTFPIAGGAAIPLPFHTALHGLFRFYSTGLLLIALLIFLYFVVVIVLETAVSGTPFGQRFQNVWVPVRLVVALWLLVPVNYGLGSGQYVVLYAAKYGSSFATNAWIGYNDAIVDHPIFDVASRNPVGERYSLLAMPEAPDISPLLQAMSIVHSCAYAYHAMESGRANLDIGGAGFTYGPINANYTNSATQAEYRVQPFLVKNPLSGMVGGNIMPNVTGNPAAVDFIGSMTTDTYLDALGFYYGNDIIIRFGEVSNTQSFNDWEGYVRPLCGDVRIPVRDTSDPGGAGAARGGADHMLRFYYQLVLYMWFEDAELRQFARAYVSNRVINNAATMRERCGLNEGTVGNMMGVGNPLFGFADNQAECAGDPTATPPVLPVPPNATFKTRMSQRYQENLRLAIVTAWSNYVVNNTYAALEDEVIDRGWGGAGIWFSKVAEINGGWMDGVNGVPFLDRYPLIMEEIRKYNLKNNENVNPLEAFKPSVQALSSEDPPAQFSVSRGGTDLAEVGVPLDSVYQYWNSDSSSFDNPARPRMQDMFVTAIHMLFGTQAMADMRSANRHLHPLAQLVMVGKGLVDSAVQNIAGASATAFLGGIFGAFKGGLGTAGGFANAASSVLYSVAFIGITAGFVLFYVLPFLPFIYFYFAVASWVKAIFEAMVGVPLWALAHLRIDGDGLPGDAAQNGYFLILEIAVRPILTVVGLVAAIAVFSAQVRVLDLLWDLVTANTAGFSAETNIVGDNLQDDQGFKRTILDEFFFTIIYTIVCYMMALAAFKLVDKIPDNILRWAGAGVSSFGDIDQEQVDSITRYASSGAMTVGNQAAGAVVDVSRGAGKTVGGQLKEFLK